MRFFQAEGLAAAASTVLSVPYNDRGTYRPVQAAMTSTGTVQVQGRNAPDLPWVNLIEFTSSGAATVAMMREMRVEITANAGNITVDLDE